MRYMRFWLVSLGLAVNACTSTPVVPTATAVPATVASVPVSPPSSTVAPVTAVPAVTAVATAEMPTEPPTSESPTPLGGAQAATTPTAEPTPVLLTGVFVKGEVPVSGSYTLDVANNTLTLSDDFQTVPGPDLYVILSGVEDVSLDFHTFSAQVLEAPLLRLGPLMNSAGAQTYVIPAGTGLAVYQSVVIWCDAFSVEFAAAPLRP